MNWKCAIRRWFALASLVAVQVVFQLVYTPEDGDPTVVIRLILGMATWIGCIVSYETYKVIREEKLISKLVSWLKGE